MQQGTTSRYGNDLKKPTNITIYWSALMSYISINIISLKHTYVNNFSLGRTV